MAVVRGESTGVRIYHATSVLLDQERMKRIKQGKRKVYKQDLIHEAVQKAFGK